MLSQKSLEQTKNTNCKNTDEVNEKKEKCEKDAKIESKRQKALLLRKNKLEERLAKQKKSISEENESKSSKNSTSPKEDLICEECKTVFHDSYLFENFGKVVCDSCRDSEEAHRLITRTEAKETYLLKDCDLDSRPPPLRFISRKNKQRKFGEMKLYLECQVAERAGEVWGSEEGLEKEMERREKEKEKTRKRKLQQKMMNLNKLTRPGLLASSPKKHKHLYGPETYKEDEDSYTKVCTLCNHILKYEKM